MQAINYYTPAPSAYRVMPVFGANYLKNERKPRIAEQIGERKTAEKNNTFPPSIYRFDMRA